MANQFQYVALDGSGTTVQGEISARSRAEALQMLNHRLLQPLSLNAPADAAGDSIARSKKVGALKPLTNSDVIHFTEELADLLDAGLQLDAALKIMESKGTTSRVGLAAARIREMVREGTRLSQALPTISKRFEGLYCNLVAAGEAGGSLSVILRKQVEYLNIMQELRSKVTQALIYPSFIFAAGIALMTIFMTVLVPQLSMLFSKSGKGMPSPTRILIGLSDILGHYWWLLVLVVIASIIGVTTFLTTARGKYLWHRSQLKLPLFGGVLSANFYAQCAHTLANLTANGIPLLDALKLFNAANSNLYLHAVLAKAADRVGEGAALSRVLARVGVFPSDFTDLVAVGEQTGDLSGALAKTATRFDKVLSVRIQRITALIQPVIIFVLAIVVGLFAYSILTGIFQAVSGLRPGK